MKTQQETGQSDQGRMAVELTANNPREMLSSALGVATGRSRDHGAKTWADVAAALELVLELKQLLDAAAHLSRGKLGGVRGSGSELVWELERLEHAAATS